MLKPHRRPLLGPWHTSPLTDKLLNFDSTYLLDITSIIGRSLVQLLGLRSKALGYRERRWEQPAVQLA